MSLTLEQERMLAANLLVDTVNDQDRREWKSLVLGFGAEVRRCGLLQTLAFIQRSEGMGKQLSKGIAEYLTKRRLLQGDAAKLVEALGRMDSDRYMLVTREVLAFSLWVKRATQGLPDPKKIPDLKQS